MSQSDGGVCFSFPDIIRGWHNENLLIQHNKLVCRTPQNNIGTFGRQSHNNIGTIGRLSHNNIGTFGRQSHNNIGTIGRQSHNNIYWCPVYLYIKQLLSLRNRPLRPSGTSPNFGEEREVFPQLLHSNVLITFLPKVRGGVAKRRRGLFFFSRHNSEMVQWRSL